MHNCVVLAWIKILVALKSPRGEDIPCRHASYSDFQTVMKRKRERESRGDWYCLEELARQMD